MNWKTTACMALLSAAGTVFAQAPETDLALNESVETLRKPGLFAVELETTVYKPDGAGPFPVAVINHGKANGDPRFQMARALANCNRNTSGKSEYRLYSVDDHIVWETR